MTKLRSVASSARLAAEQRIAERVAPMKLLVRVVEARGLPAAHVNGTSDPFVKLQLGKRRAKTAVARRSLSPVWDEEFSFLVGDIAEELVVSVLNEDKYFSNDLLGKVTVPLADVMETDDLSLGTAWYQLQPKSKKSKKKPRGEVCMHISLSTRTHVSDEPQNAANPASDEIASSSDRSTEIKDAALSTTSSYIDLSACASAIDRASHSSVEPLADGAVDQPPLSSSSMEQAAAADGGDAMANPSSVVEVLSRYFFGNKPAADVAPSTSAVSDAESVDQFQEPKMCSSEDHENPENGTSSSSSSESSSLDELLKAMESKDQGSEMPGNLPGGVLVDESYVAAPAELNSLLFSKNSDFWPAVSELQGTSGFQIEPWKLDSNGSCLQRTLTYIKAASKLVKAVKATEEQKYLKAAGNSFAVFSVVSTPDVPCGNCFKIEILYCITPGPSLASEEQTSHLTVSWRVNFVQSTMMKGMIESGAKQGMAEGFSQFSEILSQKMKVAEADDANSNKEKILSSLHAQKESGWRLIVRFLCNFTFIFSVIIASYVIAHLHLSKPNAMHGLEYFGIDLPDSIGEVVVCAVLILQGQNIFNISKRFLNAWKQKGSDHGVKAHGDGWLMTVALIEGTGIIAAGSTELFDMYAVFTCNTKRKTSSVKFQTSDPKWNEIYEFDAMDDPPSRMDVAIHDANGPFDQAPIGHTEVNFLKSNLSDLTDVWLPLDGKCDQTNNPKIHLRIFLNNSRGTEVVMNYLAKMGKEVGKKINLRSTQTNAAFRKLFNLPSEEFLIDDFTCHLKRKMPLQGRLFFSPRIIGFYSNIFGHKTKFFFLWDDVDDIQVIPPALSIGSPSLMIILRKGRGSEAKHGAKGTDPHGRLKYYFQSFVSFNDAHRIIMAIWKMRSLGPEQKGDMIEKEPDVKDLQIDEGGTLFTQEDVKMSEIFSSVLSVDVESLMEMFSGGPLEHRMMQKAGCLDYSATEWELVNRNIYQRQVSYRFDKTLSRYGGEATTNQQKYALVNQDGWAIEEVMTLQGVLLGDYFSIQMKYNMVNVPSKPNTCSVQVLLGIAWLKSTKQQKKITKSVISNSSIRLKELFAEVEKDLTSRNGAS
ncbi:C2 and GRAM domain-containing protein At1g03370-like [Oryza brachyantha]|uniref:C2 and GRAM domain-containing protein n=1 Tax=Oryza brachyantha TaxID=4533 RepID=J3MFP4_ORYBR|nr:C2 and GRAM domain-containing protein At1g03370-like [Oryza brachyantha]